MTLAERLDLGGKELHEAFADAFALSRPDDGPSLGLLDMDVLFSGKPLRALPAGYIYFIQSENGGPVKIGYTASSPESRLGDLQTGNPERLRLVSWVLGDPEDERALHRILRGSRMTGEWFRLTPLLVHLMKSGRYQPCS